MLNPTSITVERINNVATKHDDFRDDDQVIPFTLESNFQDVAWTLLNYNNLLTLLFSGSLGRAKRRQGCPARNGL